MQHFSTYSSPMGPMTIASDGHAIIGLWFNGQRHFKSTLLPEAICLPDDAISQAIQWLDIYFGGDIPNFTPPLHIIGTPFQHLVADCLLAIPYGQATTYGSIAHQIALVANLPHFSAQAVGGAVARNPISIIVPCHRVLGAKGALTGYAAGIDKKISLLQIEKRVDTPTILTN